MCHRCNKEKSRFLLGALLGGLTAGAFALLYAPKEGSRLRKEIAKSCLNCKKKAIEVEHDIEDAASEFASYTKKMANRLMRRLGGH